MSDHTDLSANELVLCHACQHEWLNAEHGLQCPACHADIVEIIATLSEAQREEFMHRHSQTPSAAFNREQRPVARTADTRAEMESAPILEDDDPDEADISLLASEADEGRAHSTANIPRQPQSPSQSQPHSHATNLPSMQVPFPVPHLHAQMQPMLSPFPGQGLHPRPHPHPHPQDMPQIPGMHFPSNLQGQHHQAQYQGQHQGQPSIWSTIGGVIANAMTHAQQDNGINVRGVIVTGGPNGQTYRQFQAPSTAQSGPANNNTRNPFDPATQASSDPSIALVNSNSEQTQQRSNGSEIPEDPGDPAEAVPGENGHVPPASSSTNAAPSEPPHPIELVLGQIASSLQRSGLSGHVFLHAATSTSAINGTNGEEASEAEGNGDRSSSGGNRNEAGGGARNMIVAFGDMLRHIMNPATAVQGDAVFSQEALDRIINQTMDMTGNQGPGPASPEAIAALPKKKVEEDMLGSDGTAECSVCMDSVTIGDEVSVLPCKHWFHEHCVGAWLNEHDTCPHCRKGIMPEGSQQPQAPRAPGPAVQLDISQMLNPQNFGGPQFVFNQTSPFQTHQQQTQGQAPGQGASPAQFAFATAPVGQQSMSAFVAPGHPVVFHQVPQMGQTPMPTIQPQGPLAPMNFGQHHHPYARNQTRIPRDPTRQAQAHSQASGQPNRQAQGQDQEDYHAGYYTPASSNPSAQPQQTHRRAFSVPTAQIPAFPPQQFGHPPMFMPQLPHPQANYIPHPFLPPLMPGQMRPLHRPSVLMGRPAHQANNDNMSGFRNPDPAGRSQTFPDDESAGDSSSDDMSEIHIAA